MSITPLLLATLLLHRLPINDLLIMPATRLPQITQQPINLIDSTKLASHFYQLSVRDSTEINQPNRVL